MSKHRPVEVVLLTAPRDVKDAIRDDLFAALELLRCARERAYGPIVEFRWFFIAALAWARAAETKLHGWLNPGSPAQGGEALKIWREATYGAKDDAGQPRTPSWEEDAAIIDAMVEARNTGHHDQHHAGQTAQLNGHSDGARIPFLRNGVQVEKNALDCAARYVGLIAHAAHRLIGMPWPGM